MENVTVAGAGGLELLDDPLPGVFLFRLRPRRDERGFFARCFCRHELAALGVEADVRQANLSHSRRRGTLRGLHYQLPPSAETKIVRCLRGRIHDVVVDLRPDSPTFRRSFAAELGEEDGRAMVVPPGCAHGFLTLTDDVLVLYFVSAPYDPARERGLRWDDPAFAIPWPFPPKVVSERDRSHPDFDPAWHLAA